MPSNISIYDKLASIGCQFSNTELFSCDIEETLVEVIETLPYAREKGRLLKVLLSWIDAFGSHVIVEKLRKKLLARKKLGADLQYAGLLASYAVNNKLHKWKPLLEFSPDSPQVFDSMKPRLEDSEEWALPANYIVAKKAISADPKYVLTRSQFASQHLQFRNRLIYGAQFRADIVTVVSLGVTTVKDIVELVGVSREPAYRVLNELRDAGFVMPEKTLASKTIDYLTL